MSDQIPIVDLRDYTSNDAARHGTFVKALGEGLERFGFVSVIGHGVDPQLLESAYSLARRTFSLPDGTKRRYEVPETGRQRGYTSFGVEHAKDQSAPDLKEFWHVGRKLPLDHPLALRKEIPGNHFPAEVAEFEPTFLRLFYALEDFALRLLDAVGEYLGEAPAFFRRMVQDGNSVLRIINYPDLGGPVPAGAIRAAQHEDINLMTVLPASTQPGLELMTREGRWIPVMTPPDVMVCDTGDMMQLLTAGRLRSTTHRVVNPEGADGGRLSMPFFLHPHPDHVITPMKPGYGSPVTAREFLLRRLREIGVA
jgi:isopenicillin N synthase-like dioxygenase